VEAITLCALHSDSNMQFETGLKAFDEEMSHDFGRLCLWRCLNLVQKMTNSNGIFSSRGKLAGSELKANFADKEHDLMDAFRAKKCYSWYFNDTVCSTKRFTAIKKKANFETLMLLD
jgi:hypothetical protein